MDPGPKLNESFRFENPKQKRLYDNLLFIGPGPAAFYKDACLLLSEKDRFEAYTHLIGHLLREIESALRAVLRPISSDSRETGLENKAQGSSHPKEIRSILTTLSFEDNDAVAKAWLSLADRNSGFALHKLAHRDALRRPRPIAGQEFIEFWNEVETLLDVLLTKFRDRFLVFFGSLDRLLALSKPSAEDVKTLKDEIPNNQVTYGYFFDRCDNPGWLDLLKAGGFFRDPPGVERDNKKGTIMYPLWSESRYLARMAPIKPELVIEITLQIPDTDNFRVVEDLVEAALKMPPDLSVKLSEKAKTWVRAGNRFFLPVKLGALVVHLAKGGYIDTALDLAGELLKISADRKNQEDQYTEKTYSVPPEPVAQFDDYHYKQTIKKYFPDLLKAAGMRAFELLLDLLETAVRLSHRSGNKQDTEDFSYIWRPAVEDHAENLSHGLKNILVTAVRDAAEQMARSDSSSVQELVRRLESHPWKIFHRIALHALRVIGDIDLSLVVDRLTSKTLFDDSGMRHEYSLLLESYFGKMGLEAQEIILAWIDEGPDLEEFSRKQEEWRGQRPSDKEVQHYRKAWQRTRLAWCKETLPDEWKDRYDALVDEIGEPPPDIPSHGATWVGPTSPKNTDELKQMGVSEIIQFLKDWVPLEGHFETSPEGLGRAFSAVVSKDTSRFAERALEFEALDPTYVRALFSGLRDAVRQNQGFTWDPVLKLCLWVVSQPREIPGRVANGITDKDPDWGWTRKAIADLLSEGFEEKRTGCLPISERLLAWSIIKVLTDDPDPTPDDESSYDKTNMDPVTLSINTTRGEAMHAVLRYALWVRRHLETLPEADKLLARGFDEMSEVRDVLEAHLDLPKDPSLAIRAVYGEWFPWIVLLDPIWAKAQLPNVFPFAESEKPYLDAVWDAYIISCSPYDNVFEVLQEQYTHAVQNLGLASGKERFIRDPEERLAEHLMTFYWRGKLLLEDDKGILSMFWYKASPIVRRHAIEFMGRSLANTEEQVPSEILSRFQGLWEKRLARAKRAEEPSNYRDEMIAFGSWFVSEKIDDKWAIGQLMEALQIAGNADSDDMVVEKLAKLVVAMPLETVKCLDLMVRGDREGWGIEEWRDKAKEILSKALRTNAASAAENLIHYLGSRDYLDFRDLLRQVQQ